MVNLLTELKTWMTILFSFFVALMLVFLRLPSWVEWIYPQWLVLMVLYWALIMPQRVNIGMAWLVGLLLDVLYNTPIGENALAMVLATYFIVRFGEKIRSLDFGKKAAVIFALLVLCQLLPLLMQVYLGRPFSFLPIVSRAIVSTVVWLLMILLFNRKGRLYFESYY